MSDLFNKYVNEIITLNFNIVSKDSSRPWGRFLVIDESQAQEFSNKFFKGIDVNLLKIDVN